MTIFKKRDIEQRLQGLEDYYLKLREALQGKEPSNPFFSGYASTKEAFLSDYVNVNFDDVLLKVEHFKVEVAAIKALKNKAPKPKYS